MKKIGFVFTALLTFQVWGQADNNSSYPSAELNTKDFWSCRSANSEFIFTPVVRDAEVYAYSIEWLPKGLQDARSAFTTTIMYPSLEDKGEKLVLKSPRLHGSHVTLEISDYYPVHDDRIKAGDITASATAKAVVYESAWGDQPAMTWNFDNIVCFARKAK